MNQQVVVFVDDDGPLRELIERYLRKKGFIVHGFSDFGSALVALESLKKVDILITDYRYCRGFLNGVEFIEQGLEIRDDFGVLVLISSMPEAKERAERSSVPIDFLLKPNLVNLFSAKMFAKNLVHLVNGLQRK
ncbi:response regulator [bacterium]|nr:MAG: response regulator [bacterium]